MSLQKELDELTKMLERGLGSRSLSRKKKKTSVKTKSRTFADQIFMRDTCSKLNKSLVSRKRSSSDSTEEAYYGSDQESTTTTSESFDQYKFRKSKGNASCPIRKSQVGRSSSADSAVTPKNRSISPKHVSFVNENNVFPDVRNELEKLQMLKMKDHYAIDLATGIRKQSDDLTLLKNEQLKLKLDRLEAKLVIAMNNSVKMHQLAGNQALIFEQNMCKNFPQMTNRDTNTDRLRLVDACIQVSSGNSDDDLRLMVSRNVELQNKCIILEKNLQKSLSDNSCLEDREKNIRENLLNVKKDLEDTKQQLFKVSGDFQNKYQNLKQEVKDAKISYEASSEILHTEYQTKFNQKSNQLESLEKLMQEAKSKVIEMENHWKLEKNEVLVAAEERMRTTVIKSQGPILEKLVNNLNQKNEEIAACQETVQIFKQKLTASSEAYNLAKSAFETQLAMIENQYKTSISCVEEKSRRSCEMASKYASKRIVSRLVDQIEEYSKRLHLPTTITSTNMEWTVGDFEKRLATLFENLASQHAKQIGDLEHRAQETEKMLAAHLNETRAQLEESRSAQQINEKTTKLKLIAANTSYEEKLADLKRRHKTRVEADRLQFELEHSTERKRHETELRDELENISEAFRAAESEYNTELTEASKQISDLQQAEKNACNAKVVELEEKCEKILKEHNEVVGCLKRQHREKISKLRVFIVRERERIKKITNDLHQRELTMSQKSFADETLKSSMLSADVQIHLQGTIEALRSQVEVLKSRSTLFEEDNNSLRSQIRESNQHKSKIISENNDFQLHSKESLSDAPQIPQTIHTLPRFNLNSSEHSKEAPTPCIR